MEIKKKNRKIHPLYKKNLCFSLTMREKESQASPFNWPVQLQELFCRRHQIVLPQLQQRFDYHTLVLFFKIKSNLAPPYLTELLPQLGCHT